MTSAAPCCTRPCTCRWPTLDAATVFPGTVHLEGTQISEGRGTTRPFELVGAPYVEAPALSRTLNSLGLSGIYFRPCHFQPTFQKHAGVTCGGVQLHVLDRQTFEPYISGVAVVKVMHELYGESFKWKEPPYEYVHNKNPFDVIAGTDKLRLAIESGKSVAEIKAWSAQEAEKFNTLRQDYLSY